VKVVNAGQEHDKLRYEFGSFCVDPVERMLLCEGKPVPLMPIEPLSLILNANKGYFLYIAQRSDESITQLKKTLEIDPSFAATHHRLGLAYSAGGLYQEAIKHFKEARRFSDGSPQALGALGYVYGQTGQEAAAHEILRRLTEISKTRYVSATMMAEVWTGLREFDEALAWLEKAVHERAGALRTFSVDPRFDCLRSEPRFQQVLQNLDSGTEPQKSQP
jgi:tetratricopeptide (TPR) repeat protein